jgi:hypothetical protein
MNPKVKIALGVVALVLVSLAPAYAAAHKSGSSHTRSQIYHDRAPKAPTHGSHPHHS